MTGEKGIFEVIAARRSIRVFTEDAVPKADLERILFAATLAPSGTNSQPWHFVVVEDREKREKMAAVVHEKMDEILTWPEAEGRERRINAYRRPFTFFKEAPVVIAVLAMDHQAVVHKTIEAHGISQRRNRPSSSHLSVGAAVQNLVLYASALGYGCCWMTGPMIAADEIEAILEVEEPWYLASVVPLGLPAENPPPRSRKGLDKVVTWMLNNNNNNKSKAAPENISENGERKAEVVALEKED